MAYNQKYLDIKIAEIQQLVLEYTGRGYTYRWVYKNVIDPKYHISYSTFNNYISKPVKKS
jgi:hypothetical protein